MILFVSETHFTGHYKPLVKKKIIKERGRKRKVLYYEI